MEVKESIKKYFKEDAQAWVEDQYDYQNYSYSNAKHRIRITLKTVEEVFGEEKINHLEIGCGNGTLASLMAKNGHNVTVLDFSEEMLTIAKKNIESQGLNVTYQKNDVEKANFPNEKFDVITALGVYEYLDDGPGFFNKINNWLKPGGLLILDFRNRLFNMVSISPNTYKEISNGTASGLLKEIEGLYHSIDKKSTVKFLDLISSSVANIKNIGLKESLKEEPYFQNANTFEGTQQTPSEVHHLASNSGFNVSSLYGIHPHLLVPKLNKNLPPEVFNSISDSLLAFEKMPFSLIWSSKFLGILKKN